MERTYQLIDHEGAKVVQRAKRVAKALAVYHEADNEYFASIESHLFRLAVTCRDGRDRALAELTKALSEENL